MIAGVWWWTSSFILEVWAETAALEGSDSREIYWLTSLFKCSMLALDSHNLIACAEKNAMPFSGELSCLCGRAVQEGLGSPQGCSSLSATTGNTWYLLYSYKVVFFFSKLGHPDILKAVCAATLAEICSLMSIYVALSLTKIFWYLLLSQRNGFVLCTILMYHVKHRKSQWCSFP